MERENKKTYNKRIVDIIATIKVILYLSIFEVVLVPIQHIIWLVSDLTFDISEYKGFVAYIILAVFAFICKKIIEKESKSSGIVGIIFGLMMILLFGYIWKFFGALMIIHSILYLIDYNKREKR